MRFFRTLPIIAAAIGGVLVGAMSGYAFRSLFDVAAVKPEPPLSVTAPKRKRQRPTMDCSPGVTVRRVLTDLYRGAPQSLEGPVAWSSAMHGPITVEHDASAVVAWPAKTTGFQQVGRLRLPRYLRSKFQPCIGGIAVRGNTVRVALTGPNKIGTALKLLTIHISKGAMVAPHWQTIQLTTSKSNEIRWQTAFALKGDWVAVAPFLQQPPMWGIRVWRIGRRGTLDPAARIPVNQLWVTIFCDPAGKTLGWVQSGHRVHLLTMRNGRPVESSLRTISVLGPALRWGAISPLGTPILLTASLNSMPWWWDRAIIVPAVGRGTQWSTRLMETGCSFSPPVISANGRYALCEALPEGNHRKQLYFLNMRKQYMQATVACNSPVTPMNAAFSPSGNRVVVIGLAHAYLLAFSEKARLPAWSSTWFGSTVTTFRPTSMKIAVARKSQ